MHGTETGEGVTTGSAQIACGGSRSHRSRPDDVHLSRVEAPAIPTGRQRIAENFLSGWRRVDRDTQIPLQERHVLRIRFHIFEFTVDCFMSVRATDR